MDSTKFQDHYDVLGVPVDADAQEVRRAFRRRVKEIHPDVSADKVGANEAFLDLKEAYNVLSDPERRAHFDVVRANHRARSRDGKETRRRATGPAEEPRAGGPATETPFGWRMPGGPMYPPPGGDTWTRYHRNLTVEDLLQRAMREIGAGRSVYARRDLAEVLAREPENPDALVLMGRLYQAEGKIDDWIRILEEGVRRNPGHAAMRLALNEARRAMATGGISPSASEAENESRRWGYLAGGLIAGALSVAWGMVQTGRPFFLSYFVPVSAALVTGMMLCALIAGWTMAATGFIAPLDEELFFPDAHGRSLRRGRRSDPPLGLAVPFFALLHYLLAVTVMATLALTRGTISRSQIIVSGTALALAVLMSLAAPVAYRDIMMWCPGWLLFALFSGWMVGDLFR